MSFLLLEHAEQVASHSSLNPLIQELLLLVVVWGVLYCKAIRALQIYSYCVFGSDQM